MGAKEDRGKPGEYCRIVCSLLLKCLRSSVHYSFEPRKLCRKATHAVPPVYLCFRGYKAGFSRQVVVKREGQSTNYGVKSHETSRRHHDEWEHLTKTKLIVLAYYQWLVQNFQTQNVKCVPNCKSDIGDHIEGVKPIAI